MNKERLKNEIDYVIESTHYSTKIELVRPLEQIKRNIYSVTNNCLPLGDFLNDYIRLFEEGKIDERMFKSSINDLYLISLQFMDLIKNKKEN